LRAFGLMNLVASSVSQILVLALALAGCGGNVVVDGDSGAAGGSSTTGAAGGSSTIGAGGGSSMTALVVTTPQPNNPCLVDFGPSAGGGCSGDFFSEAGALTITSVDAASVTFTLTGTDIMHVIGNVTSDGTYSAPRCP
jgi:hypothetical protein